VKVLREEAGIVEEVKKEDKKGKKKKGDEDEEEDDDDDEEEEEFDIKSMIVDFRYLIIGEKMNLLKAAGNKTKYIFDDYTLSDLVNSMETNTSIFN
jgi:hypothetical protein